MKITLPKTNVWEKPDIKTLGTAYDLIQGWNGKDVGPTDGQAVGLQFDS